jgi:hypothetical protein
MIITLISLGVVYKLFRKGVKTYNKYTQTDMDLYIHQILTRISPLGSVSPMHSSEFDFSMDDNLSVCSSCSLGSTHQDILNDDLGITVMEE